MRGAEDESHVLHAACSGRRLDHHDGCHTGELRRRAVARSIELPLGHQYLFGPGGEGSGRVGQLSELWRRVHS